MMFGGQTAQLHYWCQPLTNGVFNNTGYYASEEGWGEWFIVMYVHFDFHFSCYAGEKVEQKREGFRFSDPYKMLF